MDRNKASKEKFILKMASHKMIDLISKEILNGKIFLLINRDVALVYFQDIKNVKVELFIYKNQLPTFASIGGEVQELYLAERSLSEETFVDMMNKLKGKYPNKDYGTIKQLIGISIIGDMTDECKEWVVKPMFVYGTMDIENIKNVVESNLFGDVDCRGDLEISSKVTSMMPIIKMMNDNK